MSIRRAVAVSIVALCLTAATGCARTDTSGAHRSDGAGGLGPASAVAVPPPSGAAPSGGALLSLPPVSAPPVSVPPGSFPPGSPPPASSESPPVMPGQSPPPTDVNGDITISGTVHVGAEPGCLLLTSDKVEYLLELADPHAVTAGSSVQVTGHLQHGVMSHCMQGLPFAVTRVGPVT